MNGKEESRLNRLGPGEYNLKRVQEREVKRREIKVHSNSDMDYKRLKNIITNIVVNEGELPVVEEDKSKEKEVREDFMFRQDDRDRFG